MRIRGGVVALTPRPSRADMMEVGRGMSRRAISLLGFLIVYSCCQIVPTDARVCIENNETATVVVRDLANRLESVDPNSWDIERFEDALVASVESSIDSINAACVFLVVASDQQQQVVKACGVRSDEGDDVQLAADISGPPAWFNATLSAFVNGTISPAGGGMWLDSQHNASLTMTYTRPVTTSFPIGSNLTFNMSGGDLRWWGAVAVDVDASSYFAVPDNAPTANLVSCPAGESAETAEGDVGHCVPCPYPARCQGTSSGQRNCSVGTSGPLCIEIDHDHFAFGVSVLECPALPYQTIIGCSIAAFITLLAASYARRGQLFALYMKYQVNFRIWINFTQLVLAHLPLIVLQSDADLLVHAAQGVNSVAPFALTGLQCVAGQFSWHQKFFGVTGAFFLVHATLLAIDRRHDHNFRAIVRRGASIREEEKSIAARALTRQLWVLVAQILLSYWINVTMESITCVDVSGGVGDEDLRLFYEPSIVCFETTHALMLGWSLVVALFFFGLIAAVTGALLDVQRKHGYYAAVNRKQLGALYTSYTKRFMLFGMVSYWRRMISLGLCWHGYEAGKMSSWCDAAMTIVYFFYVHINSPCISHHVAVPLLPGRLTFDLYNSLEKLTTAAVFAIQILICIQVMRWWQPTQASFIVVLVLIGMSAVAIWSPWQALDSMLTGGAATSTTHGASVLPLFSFTSRSKKRLAAKRRVVTSSVREAIRSGKIYSEDDADGGKGNGADGDNRANDNPAVKILGVLQRSGSFSQKALSLHQQLMETRDKFFLACKLGQFDLAREERETVLRLNGTITEDLERREQRALDDLDTERAVEIHELRSELMISNARHVPLKALKTQLEHQLRREEQNCVDAFARLDIRCLKMYLARFHTEFVNHADLFHARKHSHDVAFDLATQELLHAIFAKNLDAAMAVESKIKALVQAYAIDLRAQLSWAVDALSPDDLPPIRNELKIATSCLLYRFGICMDVEPTSMSARNASSRLQPDVRIDRNKRGSRRKGGESLSATRDAQHKMFQVRWLTMLKGASLELIPHIQASYGSAIECLLQLLSRWKAHPLKKQTSLKQRDSKGAQTVRRKLLNSVPRNMFKSVSRGESRAAAADGTSDRTEKHSVRFDRLMGNSKIGTHMDKLEHVGNVLMNQSTHLLMDMIAAGFVRETVPLWADLETRIAMSAQQAGQEISPQQSLSSLRSAETLSAHGNAVPLVVHVPASRNLKIQYLSTRNEIEKLLHEDDDPWTAHELNDACNEQLKHMSGMWAREADSIIQSGRVDLDTAHKLLLYAHCIMQIRNHWNPHKPWRHTGDNEMARSKPQRTTSFGMGSRIGGEENDRGTGGLVSAALNQLRTRSSSGVAATAYSVPPPLRNSPSATAVG